MAEPKKDETSSAVSVETYDITGKKIARFYSFNRYMDRPSEAARENNLGLLKKYLERLGFEVESFENLEDKQMKENLKSLAEGTEALACLWIFVFATSSEEIFPCGKGFFQLHDLWKPFNGKNCTRLVGQPKMFFVQADLEKKSKFTILMNKVSVKPPEDKIIKNLPVSADIMLATFRRSEKENFSVGRLLCEEFKKPGPQNMNNIMTAVLGRKWFDTPRYSSTFCKQLCLPSVSKPSESISSTPGGPSIEKYITTGKRMAYSFVFGDFKFLYKLPGAEADKTSIEKAMKAKGFIYEDCNPNGKMTASEVKIKMEEISKNKENADCVMIFVSTHGGGGHKLYAWDESFTMHDLWSPFTHRDGYKGKPKIFIVDGCRGVRGEERAERNVYVAKVVGRKDKHETDISAKESDEEEENPFGESEDDTINEQPEGMSNEAVSSDKKVPYLDNSDIIIGLSTVNGNIALQSDCGSPYIQDICKKLQGCKNELNLLDLLVSANFYVATAVDAMHEKKECCQMPTFTSSLKNYIYI